jgi:hypothetical protein
MNASQLAGIDLNDIHAAPPPEFWPPAPGWWMLAIILLSVLAFIYWYLLITWRQRRKQVLILNELDHLSSTSTEELATQVSNLLRRVSLMCFPRQEVASLNGKAWLKFLDRTGGDGNFTDGVGNVLATAPYALVDSTAEIDKDALKKLARKWIKQNLRQKR